ncbi:hypothetical protein [Lactococcus garvieae]|uniref:hypothetical protein n=1 Tax=Lactococcus garvieae TaxID=1363 RepID=UPI0038533EA3
MNPTLTEQIYWLKRHYRDYSMAWYQSNPARTQAIYRKEYGKYLHLQKERVCRQLKEEREEKRSFWEEISLSRYHKSFEELSRSEKRTLVLEENIRYA